MEKHIFESSILGRTAHADVSLGAQPLTHAFLLFGGSGIDEEEYLHRMETVNPIFHNLLDQHPTRNFIFAYVCAPFDVPFRRFSENPELAEDWNKHVLEELLKPWEALPFFVCGFSGGNALAFNGIQADPKCFGGACLGGDSLPRDFTMPQEWQEPLKIYSAINDDVANHPANREIADYLAESGMAEQYLLRSGRHRLIDYVTPECIGRLFSQASALAEGY